MLLLPPPFFGGVFFFFLGFYPTCVCYEIVESRFMVIAGRDGQTATTHPHLPNPGTWRGVSFV